MEKQTMNYDELFAGDFPVMPIEITIGTNQSVKRGDLLVKDTTKNEYLKATKAIVSNPTVVSASNETKMTPPDIVVVASEDIITTENETAISTGYRTGEFNKDKIGFGGESTLADNFDALMEKMIFLR